MHEVHLVKAILETASREAAAKGATRVSRVRIRYNPLTSHSGDHVRFSFDIVKKEFPSMAEAELDLEGVPPALRCRSCGAEFEGKELPEVCPKCGSVEVDALHPTDMVLLSFEAE
jgi:hydrogenase nickel incorporation protein HypA/HybF